MNVSVALPWPISRTHTLLQAKCMSFYSSLHQLSFLYKVFTVDGAVKNKKLILKLIIQMFLNDTLSQKDDTWKAICLNGNSNNLLLHMENVLLSLQRKLCPN